ncbi:MAG TPA: DUF6580 family putative transport protein [Candidatus Saccharimonadales bacterium]|nr:DUF6580 family putative transport protein [Candidatus Saccharimonadales bacterium]
MKKLIAPRTNVLALMIILAGAWRLLLATPIMTSFSNFTPIGAIALFGGCYYITKSKALSVTLLTLWLSDLLLDRVFYYHSWVLFYSGFAWVYGAFSVMVIIGKFIKKVNVRNIILACILATLAHWIITDLGVWLAHTPDPTTGKPYAFNLAGYIRCLDLAIPYEKNLLIGNLVFSGVMFGAFEWAQRRFPILRLQQRTEQLSHEAA